MKYLIIAIFVILICSSVSAQLTLEKIWESDSVTLQNPESVLYDPSSNSLFVSSMGSGSIVQLDQKGMVINDEWISGLNSNKRLGDIRRQVLYVRKYRNCSHRYG